MAAGSGGGTGAITSAVDADNCVQEGLDSVANVRLIILAHADPQPVNTSVMAFGRQQQTLPLPRPVASLRPLHGLQLTPVRALFWRLGGETGFSLRRSFSRPNPLRSRGRRRGQRLSSLSGGASLALESLEVSRGRQRGQPCADRCRGNRKTPRTARGRDGA